ncbi:MAG TPA: hypothetical protein ENN58_03720 [bacterium]|nr:hypothetical protein [bacterium]
MLSKILSAIFGSDADEVHLFGSSFKERIEEGIEILVEGADDMAEAFSSFDDESNEYDAEECEAEIVDEN